jgi:hypothetical protein
MQAIILDAVVEEGLEFYNQYRPGQRFDSDTLHDLCAQTIACEREGASTPAHGFLDIVKHTTGVSILHRFRMIAQDYLARTAYLLPVIDAFGRISLKVMQRCGCSTLANFLRDGLVFWPTQTVVLGDQPSMAWFSRWHAEHDQVMQVYRPGDDGRFRELAEGVDFAKTLLIDAGLYGSLIQRLIVQYQCQESLSVFFFASRSPYIAGFYNLLSGAEWLTADQWDPLNTIKVIA